MTYQNKSFTTLQVTGNMRGRNGWSRTAQVDVWSGRLYDAPYGEAVVIDAYSRWHGRTAPVILYLEPDSARDVALAMMKIADEIEGRSSEPPADCPHCERPLV